MLVILDKIYLEEYFLVKLVYQILFYYFILLFALYAIQF